MYAGTRMCVRCVRCVYLFIGAGTRICIRCVYLFMGAGTRTCVRCVCSLVCALSCVQIKECVHLCLLIDVYSHSCVQVQECILDVCTLSCVQVQERVRCVYSLMCVGPRCVHLSVWRPEFDVRCLPQLLSTLFLEAESLIGLELDDSTRWAD